jgi:hypothetical protein
MPEDELKKQKKLIYEAEKFMFGEQLVKERKKLLDNVESLKKIKKELEDELKEKQ